MDRWAKSQQVLARWGPLVFAFCATLAAAGVWLEPKNPLQVCHMKYWRVAPIGSATVVKVDGPATPKGSETAPQPSLAQLQAQLPASLRTAIAGPKLYVKKGGWQEKERPAKRHTPVPGRIVLKTLGAGMRRLDYVAGKRLRPEVVRLPSRAQLRVLVSTDRSSARRLKGYARKTQGLQVSVQPLGNHKLAVKVQCDARCELGQVQASRRGWSLPIKQVQGPALSLRRR